MRNWPAALLQLDMELNESMTGDVVHRLFVSGQLALRSGIYRAEHAGGECVFEAVMVRGSRLPVCSECRQPLIYSLQRCVPHLSEDEDFAQQIQ